MSRYHLPGTPGLSPCSPKFHYPVTFFFYSFLNYSPILVLLRDALKEVELVLDVHCCFTLRTIRLSPQVVPAVSFFRHLLNSSLDSPSSLLPRVIRRKNFLRPRLGWWGWSRSWTAFFDCRPISSNPFIRLQRGWKTPPRTALIPLNRIAR